MKDAVGCGGSQVDGFHRCDMGMIYAGEQLWLLGMSSIATMVVTYFTHRFPVRTVSFYSPELLGRMRYRNQVDQKRRVSLPIIIPYPIVLFVFSGIDLTLFFGKSCIGETCTHVDHWHFLQGDLVWPHLTGALVGFCCWLVERRSTSLRP